MKVPEPKKLPSGNYNLRMRLGGEEISITRATARECRLEAQIIKADYKAGKRLPSTPAEKRPIGELMDAYIDDRAKVLSPSTINGYRAIRRNRFKAYMSSSPSAISNWQAVINAELSDGISEKSLKNAWGLLSASLGYAGLPVPQVKLPTVVQETRPWLDAEQIRIFVAAAHCHPVEIPALLALHSLRRSEILGLDWKNIDLEKGMITVIGSAVIGPDNQLVYKKTNKTAKSRRTIPIMIPELKAALEQVPQEKRSGKLYTKTPTLIWEQVNRICEKNGLPAVGVHGLRHSFASLAYHLGLSELETMELGGWSDTGTMRKIYTHLSERDRRKAENKIADFFKNADENADGD